MKSTIFNCTLACPLLSSSLTLPTQLYKHGRYYPFYQIIIPGWYVTDDWGKMEDGEFNFTSEWVYPFSWEWPPVSWKYHRGIVMRRVCVRFSPSVCVSVFVLYSHRWGIISSHVPMTVCDVYLGVVIGHMHASLHQTRWGLYTVLCVGSSDKW